MCGRPPGGKIMGTLGGPNEMSWASEKERQLPLLMDLVHFPMGKGYPSNGAIEER